jgi:hypothetical protein
VRRRICNSLKATHAPFPTNPPITGVAAAIEFSNNHGNGGFLERPKMKVGQYRVLDLKKSLP